MIRIIDSLAADVLALKHFRTRFFAHLSVQRVFESFAGLDTSARQVPVVSLKPHEHDLTGIREANAVGLVAVRRLRSEGRLQPRGRPTPALVGESLYEFRRWFGAVGSPAAWRKDSSHAAGTAVCSGGG